MKVKIYIVFVVVVVFQSVLLADTIKVHNRTSKIVYEAPYYKNGLIASQCGDVGIIKPGFFIKIQRPSYKNEVSFSASHPANKFNSDRKLYISRKLKNLKETLAQIDRRKITSQKVPWIYGSDFYIAEVDGRLKSFNSFEWNIVRPIVEAAQDFFDQSIQLIRDSIKKVVPAVRCNPYKKISATVRCGNNLCEQEVRYLKKRRQHVKRSIEKIVGHSIKDGNVPTISIVASGGGFRAMLATIGFLSALEEAGLLDAVTYISSLSGSAWAVGSWFSSGESIASLKKILLPHLAPGLLPISSKEIRYFVDMLLAKWAFDQPVTTVDFYGALVGNRLLKHCGKLRHRIYLSEQRSLLEDGKNPFPIYSAIRSDSYSDREWWEFTPYEIGGAWLGHYVPSWGFGRKFKKGKSIDYSPEQSLSNHLGVFGSAFAVTFNRMYREIKDSISCNMVKKVVERMLEEIGHVRLVNSCFHNFTAGLKSSPVERQRHVKLVDAGIAFNLPYPPVSGERIERKSDIIIFLDASFDIKGVPGLKGAALYALDHGLKFPSIDKPEIDERAITVLEEKENMNCPVAIYMPWVKDEKLWAKMRNSREFRRFVSLIDRFSTEACLDSFCDTFNFEYRLDQAHQVAALAEFNMLAHKETIVDVIKDFINKRA